MKNIIYSAVFILISLSNITSQTATEIIEKADLKYRGESSFSEIIISIIRPKWEKSMSLKTWTKGSDYSVSIVLSPAKEKGTVFLKRKNEVWNYLPTLERTIKLPPSMMMQSWMGTDLTNDDLVKQSSQVTDYTHKILSTETIEGYKCWKIELLPKEDASVVWGKMIIWIDKIDYMQLRSEFYDEDDEMINILSGTDIKTFGNKKLPSKMQFIPIDEKGNKTIIEYKTWEFDIDIPSNYFNTQYISRIK